MTQHPTLKLKGASAEHRSVLKRFERILKLQKEEKWKEGDPIFGLPKVKTTRLKIKKEKAAPAPEKAGVAAEGAPGAVPAEAAKAAPEAPQTKPGKPDKSKEAKPTQESAKKSGEKK